MAIHANSTTAPARPLLPPAALPPRDARGRFAKRTELPAEPLLQAEAPEPATLDDVRREMEALLGGTDVLRGAVGVVSTTPTVQAPDTSAAARRDLGALVAQPRPLKSEQMVHDPDLGHVPDQGVSAAERDRPVSVGSVPVQPAQIWLVDSARNASSVLNYLGNSDVVAEPDTAARARAHHLRRQLTAAIDHGAALLPALGLPRLVEAGFTPIDAQAAEDAIEAAIGALDALDAPGEDMEDDEREIPEDDEPFLGAPENHPGRFHFDMDARYHVGRRLHALGNQTTWAAGQDADTDVLDRGEPEAGYDLPEGDDERDGDGSTFGEAGDEPSIGWPNDFTARFVNRDGADFDAEADDTDLEPDGERMVVRRPLGLFEQPASHLVARARAMRCGTAAPSVDLPRPWLGADRVFGLHVEGDCCAPEILNNGSVHVDKEAAPQAGDFVALWFEAERAGRPVMVGWVKRLAVGLPPGMRWPFRAAPGNELEPVLAVESLNPPRQYMIDIRKVHAVFKVVNILPPAEAIAARQRMRLATRR